MRMSLGSHVSSLTSSQPRSQGLLSRELRRFLEKQLPAAMVPATFVMLETLPLTPSGKVDRQALPVLARSGLPSKTSTSRRVPLLSNRLRLSGATCWAWNGLASTTISLSWEATRSWPCSSCLVCMTPRTSRCLSSASLRRLLWPVWRPSLRQRDQTEQGMRDHGYRAHTTRGDIASVHCPGTLLAL